MAAARGPEAGVVGHAPRSALGLAVRQLLDRDTERLRLLGDPVGYVVQLIVPVAQPVVPAPRGVPALLARDRHGVVTALRPGAVRPGYALPDLAPVIVDADLRAGADVALEVLRA